MNDYFALLDEARRPWLDAEALKQKFLARSAEVHPDRVHQLGEAERLAADRRYKELNAAYQCLRGTRDRLRHLLELERGARPADLQEVPSHLVDLCLKVGKLCREGDRFLAEMAQVTSPILRAERFAQGQELADKLMQLQSGIAAEQERVNTSIRSLDMGWNNPEGRVQTLPELEKAYRLLGFFMRWSGQLQERIVRFAV